MPAGRRTATLPFSTTHFVLPLAACVALTLLFASSSIDVSLAHAWAYDDALQLWLGRRRWWVEVLLHRGGRDAMMLVIVALLATLAMGFISAHARAARRTAVYVLVTMTLGWGLVGGLKQVTNVALLVGSAFALCQEARGAHFLSHDVCSAFIVWFVALATYSVRRSADQRPRLAASVRPRCEA